MGQAGLTLERTVLIDGVPGPEIGHRVVVVGLCRLVTLTSLKQFLNRALFPF
jgi:hypothetical protein